MKELMESFFSYSEPLAAAAIAQEPPSWRHKVKQDSHRNDQTASVTLTPD